MERPVTRHVSCGTETPGFEHASRPLTGQQQPHLLRPPVRVVLFRQVQLERCRRHLSNYQQPKRGHLLTLAAVDRGITGDAGSTREASAATSGASIGFVLGLAGSTGSAGSASSNYASKDGDEFGTNSGVIASRGGNKAKVDYLGESTYGNFHFVERLSQDGIGITLGLDSVDSILTAPYQELKKATQGVLTQLNVAPSSYPGGSPMRGIFCSRTLNLRSIQAIGYDLDYTLLHYSVEQWEGRAYEHGLAWLREQGCPVEGLKFDPGLVVRGLIVDKELGNLVKVDRFGYVKRAMHGTRMLSWAEIHSTYGRQLVNLRDEGRWAFLNTLFSVSEAVMYMQLVDRLDDGEVDPLVVPNSYAALYRLVSRALYHAHVEGKLKAEILANPDQFVELDPEAAQTLLDQKQAGKALLLITNSDWQYTTALMSYAYDKYLPAGMKWRDLFDMVIVNARKPEFFRHDMSLYEVVTDDGLMRPTRTMRKGGVYCGGSARQVEASLGMSGDDILYVGDHIYTDAALAKLNFRWRTCLVVRELEQEVEALTLGRPHRQRLKELMNKKELIGDLFNQLRLARQRACNAQPGPNALINGEAAAACNAMDSIAETLAQLLAMMEQLDRAIGPMLEADGAHFSQRWGYLSRAGLNDKSQFTRQIEKYADIYTSRVSNFLRYTPFNYFRSPSQSLAHDRDLTDYYKRKYMQQQVQVHQQQQQQQQEDAAQPMQGTSGPTAAGPKGKAAAASSTIFSAPASPGGGSNDACAAAALQASTSPAAAAAALPYTEAQAAAGSASEIGQVSEGSEAAATVAPKGPMTAAELVAAATAMSSMSSLDGLPALRTPPSRGAAAGSSDSADLSSDGAASGGANVAELAAPAGGQSPVGSAESSSSSSGDSIGGDVELAPVTAARVDSA